MGGCGSPVARRPGVQEVVPRRRPAARLHRARPVCCLHERVWQRDRGVPEEVRRREMNRDLVFGIATLAMALVYYALTSTIPQSQLADPVGPQGLPKTYAVILATLSVLLIARSLKRAPGQVNREIANRAPANLRI